MLDCGDGGAEFMWECGAGRARYLPLFRGAQGLVGNAGWTSGWQTESAQFLSKSRDPGKATLEIFLLLHASFPLAH